MRKILYLAVLLVSAVVMSLPVTTFAATVTFNTDTTLALPNGISLTVLSGSVADALVVNDNSTLTLTVGADTNITIRSTNVYTLTSSGGTTACVGGSYNQITFSGVTAGDYTITVSTATACTVDSGGSGPPAIGEISKKPFETKRMSGHSTKAARKRAAGAIMRRANRRSATRTG